MYQPGQRNFQETVGGREGYLFWCAKGGFSTPGSCGERVSVSNRVLFYTKSCITDISV